MTRQMTQHASGECQRYCGVIRGPVHDVYEVDTDDSIEESSVAFVSIRSSFLALESNALVDLGDEQQNMSYLRAIQACAGPDISRKLGVRMRMQGCNAPMGDYKLEEYLR